MLSADNIVLDDESKKGHTLELWRQTFRVESFKDE